MAMISADILTPYVLLLNLSCLESRYRMRGFFVDAPSSPASPPIEIGV
jgi:hypothetical protein